MSTTDLAPQLLHQRYYQTRDLNSSPDQSIVDQLLTISTFTKPLTLLDNYIATLQQLNPDLAELTGNTIRHAVVSHLIQLQLAGKSDLAYFLAKPTVDPLEQIVPNGHRYDRVAVAGWEDEHTARNMTYVDEIIDFMAQRSEQGRAFFFSGPMFSAKSDGLLSVVQHAADSGLIGKCHALIFSGLNEDYITARRGGRGRSSPVESSYRLKANPVDLAEFVKYVAETEFNRGDLLVFDEIAFLAWSEEEQELLRMQISTLVSKGVITVFSGLNTDYRAISLPSAGTVTTQSNTFDCNAFSLVPHESGFTSVPATSSARIDLRSGLVDLLLPIVVGRNWGIVQYMPVPEDAHIFASLHKHDPDLYERLLAVGEQKELLDWYIDQHET